MPQPENIFIGPVDSMSHYWASEVIRLYNEELTDPSEPYPPRMDGDLLMVMPKDGNSALNQAGFWLDPEAVYISPVPHKALGICRIVAD